MIVVPMRAHSARLPDKHIRKVGGRMLMDYTLEYLKFHNHVEDTIVVTDDIFIHDYWHKAGFAVVMEEKSTDSIFAAAKLAYESWNKDEVEFVHIHLVTTPFKTPHLFDRMEAQCIDDRNACITLCDPIIHPMNLWRVNGVQARLPSMIGNTQDIVQYQVSWNGICLKGELFEEICLPEMWKVSNFWTRLTLGYIFVPNDPWVDVDTQRDLRYFEFLLNHHTPYWMPV